MEDKIKTKKTTTSLTINPELLEMAKANNINLSGTLEEALLIKLNVNGDERVEVIEKMKKAEAEQKFYKKKLEEINQEADRQAEKALIDRIKKFRGLG